MTVTKCLTLWPSVGWPVCLGGSVCACASVCQGRRKTDPRSRCGQTLPQKQPRCRQTDLQPSASTCSALPPRPWRPSEGSQSTLDFQNHEQDTKT